MIISMVQFGQLPCEIRCITAPDPCGTMPWPLHDYWFVPALGLSANLVVVGIFRLAVAYLWTPALVAPGGLEHPYLPKPVQSWPVFGRTLLLLVW